MKDWSEDFFSDVEINFIDNGDSTCEVAVK